MEIRNLAGARRFAAEKMVKNNLFETPRFFLDLYCLEPGQSQDLHRHPTNDKVYIVQQGKGRFQVGLEESVLEAGQAVLAPAGVEHGAFNDGPERLVVLTFMAPHPRLPGVGSERSAAAASERDSQGGAAALNRRLEQLRQAYDRFVASFDRIWTVIARGEAGNLVGEALEDPSELERAQQLRSELELALRRLADGAPYR